MKIYSLAAGYLFVGSSALGHQDLSIPFRLIRRIDRQGIVLWEPRDELATQYTEPPSISTMVENRLVPGPHRERLPQADEVRVAESGYDGTPTW